ncbi:hypothetical protein B0T14DRAFT_85118 [Immersiella caudata]|uniref:Uncharacterized protein n=1 Tax=Immersiella caudata TaxID=314043 RepID=A0AA39XHB7_9PEZI|nr:hypothetical protein B0T14DRAFT_85118 [Immersiella caudata]
MSSMFFVSARDKTTAEFLHRRIISGSGLLKQSPLYLLAFVLDERLDRYWAWLDGLRRQISEIETVTGMVPDGWRMHVRPEDIRRLKKPVARLKQLHGSQIQLSHLVIVLKFLLRLGTFCVEATTAVEELRGGLGLPKTKKSHEKMLFEHTEFFISRLESAQDKAQEVIERHQIQVNVV